MIFKPSVTRLMLVIVLLGLGAPPFRAEPVQDPIPARSLGDIKLISGPTPCNGQLCYVVEVSCPPLVESVRASIKVGSPADPLGYRGMILFTTGGAGSQPWEQWSPEAPRVLLELWAAGFQTAQVAWGPSWFQGAPERFEGIGQLACRPATVAQWIYDHLRSNQEGPFCASGNSNGASQLAYMLTQYGLADMFSTVVLDGGPNWARVDQGCIHNDPANQALWYNRVEANDIDRSFGFSRNTGPCARMDSSVQGLFQETSLAFGDWPYSYQRTLVWFLIGENDQSTTAAHGMAYYEQLVQEGSPLIHLDIVPNSPHVVFATKEGADMIRDILINECHSR